MQQDHSQQKPTQKPKDKSEDVSQKPVQHKQKPKYKPGIYNFRQGICRHVPLEKIISYVDRFKKIMASNKEMFKLDSIQKFRKDTRENIIIKMCFQGALDQIPKQVSSLEQVGRTRSGILYGMSIDQVLDLINVAAQTPPSFYHSQFAGVPINAILVDLIDTDFGKSLFSHPAVNKHLRNIFNDYGKMLHTKKSLMYVNSEGGGWLCKDALNYINYDEFVCDQSLPHFGFKSWNDWFTRSFKEGERPVDGKDDPLVIVHAAQNYPLTTLNLPYLNVQKFDKFWLKDNRYSLYDMFEAEQMNITKIIDESFVGGTIYQGFLSPWCYHWWHTPVSGTVQKSYLIPGNYYLQNPSFDMSGINNYINSQSFLSCVSTRHVFIINTNDPRVGRVAVIEIGMVEVASCIPLVNVGDEVTKGDQIGRFQFGGSSHVIVFDKRVKLDFNPAIYDREDKSGFDLSIKQKINTWLAKVVVEE